MYILKYDNPIEYNTFIRNEIDKMTNKVITNPIDIFKP